MSDEITDDDLFEVGKVYGFKSITGGRPTGHVRITGESGLNWVIRELDDNTADPAFGEQLYTKANFAAMYDPRPVEEYPVPGELWILKGTAIGYGDRLPVEVLWTDGDRIAFTFAGPDPNSGSVRQVSYFMDRFRRYEGPK